MDTTFTTNWYDANYSYLFACAEQVHYLLALHVAQIENQPPTVTNPDGSFALIKDAMPAPPALQQFSMKPATKMNPTTNPSLGFSTFICGTFDCNSL